MILLVCMKMLCNLYRVNKQITKNIISNVEKRDFNGFIEVSFLLGVLPTPYGAGVPLLVSKISNVKSHIL